MDSTCAEGSFFLAFTNGSHPSNQQLDYDSLPPLFSADGTSVPRDDIEGTGLCDDPCQPISGGGTCRALSCYEVRRGGVRPVGGEGLLECRTQSIESQKGTSLVRGALSVA